MAKGLARTFGQDLMRGEHEVGTTTNGGVLMPSHTSGDPSFYAKKRAREAEIGRELTTEEFLSGHYEASDAPIASGTSIFDPVLCEIAYRWFCPQGGTVLDPFAGGRASRVFPTCATHDVQIGSSRSGCAASSPRAWGIATSGSNFGPSRSRRTARRSRSPPNRYRYGASATHAILALSPKMSRPT